jgi:hypothetical protein
MNTRVRPLVLRPGLSAGLPLSDFRRQYILTDGVNFQSCDIVLYNLLRLYSHFLPMPSNKPRIALQSGKPFIESGRLSKRRSSRADVGVIVLVVHLAAVYFDGSFVHVCNSFLRCSRCLTVANRTQYAPYIRTI